MWNDLFKNTSCRNNVTLEEVFYFYFFWLWGTFMMIQVDGVLLDKMCPTKTCPLYEDFTGRYKRIGKTCLWNKTYYLTVIFCTLEIPDELKNGLLITSSGTYSYQLPARTLLYLFMVSYLKNQSDTVFYPLLDWRWRRRRRICWWF